MDHCLGQLVAMYNNLSPHSMMEIGRSVDEATKGMEEGYVEEGFRSLVQDKWKGFWCVDTSEPSRADRERGEVRSGCSVLVCFSGRTV